MQLALHRRAIRRAVVFASLAGLLGAGTLTLTQCRMVQDSLTGVSLAKDRASSCLARCSDDKKTAMKAEQDLHMANQTACNGDSACHDAEEARHVAAVDAILAQYEACKANCHHQGAGGSF